MKESSPYDSSAIPGPDYVLTVLIPTFNEEENIVPMIRAIGNVCQENRIHAAILVVDDNSTDQTLARVRELMHTVGNLSLLVRYENPGLSQSLYDGFLHAESDIVQCIDCDFSHPPELIPAFYAMLRGGAFDMAIGSRYVPGGGSVNWPLSRRVLSYGAALMGRIAIPIVHDSGSGFFAINRSVLKEADLVPRGFRMGFEILGKGNWDQVVEIPFVFKNRDAGKSKLKPLIIYYYIIQFMDIFSHNLRSKKSGNIRKAWKMFLGSRR
jgi:dolichol-phosphate mannosyltransferase